MKDMKLSNIQKESEKAKIKKNINEYEDLKTRALLNLGIMTFDKIRKNEIKDIDFNELCEEIKNYDIEIYTRYMQLRSFEKENNKTTCECGFIAMKNEKFCPQCGNSLIKEETSYIVCENCYKEIEEDSNFCPCCGNKINKVSTKYNDFEEVSTNNIMDEIIYDEEIIDDYKENDEDEFLEKEGRDFITNHENNIIK